MDALNDITNSAANTLKSAIDNMNKALASAPKQYQPFFADLNTRLIDAMKNKDPKAVEQVQKDILKFIENERKK